MEEQARSIQISGSGTISGGRYENVVVSGSGRAEGDIECAKLSISGSGRLNGRVEAREVKVSGSGHFAGEVAADDVRASGSAHFEKGLTARQSVKISGGGTVEGLLRAKSATVSGSVKLGGGAECEEMNVSGGFCATGLINAGTLIIRLGGDCVAEEIGGDTVVVVDDRPGRQSRPLNLKIFGLDLGRLGPSRSLRCESIEANKVHLESTVAKIVRGGEVEIGPGCEIERVEYSAKLTVDEDAKVGERVKV